MPVNGARASPKVKLGMDVGTSLLVWVQVEPLIEIGAGLRVWVSRRVTKVSDTLFISLGSVDQYRQQNRKLMFCTIS